MQVAIVYAVVAAAFVYAAWILMPGALRRWLVAAASPPAPQPLRGWLARVQASAGEAGCSTCKACPTDAKSAPLEIKMIEFRRR
jgi:hypothetical protein